MEYLVALPIEAMPLGCAYPQGTPLPLHCTVMQSFSLGPMLKYKALDEKLVQLAVSVRGGIELVSEQPALFGPNNDVPCHTLRWHLGLETLHWELFEFLVSQGGVTANPQYMCVGYRPHVSSRG